MGSRTGAGNEGQRERGARRPRSGFASGIKQAAFEVGEIVADKYRVERILGQGSMGIVVAATHLQLDEMVALKFIRPDLQTLPGVVGRFAREAKASVRIKSDHVVKVLDVAMVPERGPCIVMEYLEGETLADLLLRSGPLTVRRAVEYVMQACEALTAAHVEGITHRDIKPENLFIVRRGDLEVIKLLDFGISKAALTGSVFGGAISKVEATSFLMGTPLYMSPEQIVSTGAVDHRTDIWSLGAVMYEMLTGRTPFVGSSVAEQCALVLDTDPAPLRARCAFAPPDLEAVVTCCLQKDLSRRYQNVAEVAIDLVPLASSRVRPYAQRCASILRAAGVDIGVRLSESSIPIPSLGAVAVNVSPHRSRAPRSLSPSRSPSAPSSRLPLPTVERQERLSARPAPAAPRRRFALAAPIGVGLAAALTGAMLIRPPTRGSSAAGLPDRTVLDPVAPAAGYTADPPPTRPAAAPLAQSFRPVVVESEPPGALVELGDRTLGKTPLHTLVEAGPLRLRLSKPGYVTEETSFTVERAIDESQPIHKRIVLLRATAPRLGPSQSE